MTQIDDNIKFGMIEVRNIDILEKYFATTGVNVGLRYQGWQTNFLVLKCQFHVQAISHLIHRDYEAIVNDFVTLQFIPRGGCKYLLYIIPDLEPDEVC